MSRFIKVTSIDNDCSDLNICIDSIEEFYGFNPKFSNLEDQDGGEYTRIYLKSAGSSWHNISETPEEIEALIKKEEIINAIIDP